MTMPSALQSPVVAAMASDREPTLADFCIGDNRDEGPYVGCVFCHWEHTTRGSKLELDLYTLEEIFDFAKREHAECDKRVRKAE